jgi:hypothetical protein
MAWPTSSVRCVVPLPLLLLEPRPCRTRRTFYAAHWHVHCFVLLSVVAAVLWQQLIRAAQCCSSSPACRRQLTFLVLDSQLQLLDSGTACHQ